VDIQDLLNKVEAKTAERLLKAIKEETKKKGDSPLRDELNTSENSEQREDSVQFAPDDDSLPTIVIITALYDPECVAVLRAFDCQWRKEGREGVLYRTGILDLNCKRIQLVVASQSDMGMVPATILATKSIISWRPHLITMTGICAGVKEKVRLGDLIIAKQVVDYGSGKLKEDKFVPDYSTISLDSSCANYIQEFSSREDIMRSIRDAWEHKTGKPDTELQAHLGVIGSGAAVIARSQFVEEIQEYKRSILGIEMEAYGIAKAAEDAFPGKVKSLIIKGVQDYADDFKSDTYREYSAFVSAQFLKKFLDECTSHLL
jgi:nucleoside phosphorylase